MTPIESRTSTHKKGQFQNVDELLQKMTLSEKIGQMSQFASREGLPDDFRAAIRQGKVGSVLNEVDADTLQEIQRIAREESRLGIPIIFGRDVIHGFHTMFPIPLGQAASWNPDLVKLGARVAAIEASAAGLHWTFAPMIDITRDPRWGRIAESLGEDPYLASQLGVAMVKGFQGEDLSAPESIAACAKHFAGYGYSEAGKDYAYVNISENELRNVVLPPFKAVADAGVATFMAAFSDVNGVPASGNEFLMKKILREEWGYDGFVVSDWDSVIQLMTHGFSANEKEAAYEAVHAGVDMEMASHTYLHHLEALVNEGRISMEKIDQCVRNILKVKFDLGLFEKNQSQKSNISKAWNGEFLEVSKQAALESIVMLKNDYNKLPLRKEEIQDIAIIGPLADDGYEQMGTWTFDGKEEWCQTPLQSLKAFIGEDCNLHFARGMETTRSRKKGKLYKEAIEVAKKCDTIIFFLGEEAILSGEAHSRADIDLPGYQNELLEEISKLGKSTVLVIMAGRPLTLTKTQHYVNAMLYAWHPGTMGGPALVDILFGKTSPSGKLPVTFPKMVGQIPIYYNQRNSGKPATHDSFTHIDDIPVRAGQTSVGNTSFHLDAGFEPLYPFGFGLSYGYFEYHNIWLSKDKFPIGESIEVHVQLSNHGRMAGEEVVQLYVRDLVGSVTRPVKELKGFQRVYLEVGATTTVTFQLHSDDLAFYNRKMKSVTEPGRFDVWVGGDANAHLKTSFEITKD
ncbi:MAG: beta-glucosidase BglX [Bacteroidota bacterium]